MTFASSQVPQSTAPNASTRERARTHSPGESLTGRIYTPWLDKQRTKRRTENSSVRMTCGARTPWPIAGHARYGARRAERPPLQAPTFSTRRVAMYARPGAAPRSVGPTRNAAPWRAHSTNHGPHGVRSSSSAFDTFYDVFVGSAPTAGPSVEASSPHESQPSSDTETPGNEQDDMPVHSTPHTARALSMEPCTSVGDTSLLDRLMTPIAPRKRGRPRKETTLFQHGADKPAQAHAIPASQAPHAGNEPPTKRKRGRPRKRPLEPHEEFALMAAKQSASIPPWQVIHPVDRPPIYPETHVFVKAPRQPRTPMLWESPERPKPPVPRWWHYRRPTLQHVPAKRTDGITSEPLPLAPPGRRPRTRVDVLTLQHTQLANRARGAQLDLHALWQRRVAQAIAAGECKEPEGLSKDASNLST